jgi:hypothetical protein
LRLARTLHCAAPWCIFLIKNKQHDTSKVLRLPRKMTLDLSQALQPPKTSKNKITIQRQRIELLRLSRTKFDAASHLSLKKPRLGWK